MGKNESADVWVPHLGPDAEPVDWSFIDKDKTGWNRPRILSDIHVGMILAWKMDGASNVEVARRLGVCEGTVRKYLKEYKEENK
jgi:hypothetical protein